MAPVNGSLCWVEIQQVWNPAPLQDILPIVRAIRAGKNAVILGTE